MLRPFRDGPAFMLPVVAHVQVWGALHILPSRAIEDLFGAQLFVHWHYCPRAAPQGVRLMQRRVRSEAAPFATRPLAVPKPGCRPLPEMLSVQRATTERRSDSSRYRCAQRGRPRLSCYECSPRYRLNSFVRGSCRVHARPWNCTYEWNKGEEYMRMAAFTTHKREEVSVEELRAMQYTQRE